MAEENEVIDPPIMEPTPPTAPDTSTVIDGIVGDCSELNQSTIDGLQAEHSPIPTGVYDKAKQAFNKVLHMTKPDGSPMYTKKGNFRKRPGRKTGGPSKLAIPKPVAPAASPVPGIAPTAMDDPAKKERGYQRAARAYAMMLETGGRLVCGPQAGFIIFRDPTTKMVMLDERKDVTEAAYDVCKEYDFADIPPVIGLVMVTGLYAFRAVQTMPVVKKGDKELTWYEKLKLRYFLWRNPAVDPNSKKVTNGSYNSNRNDGKREVDTSKVDDTKV